MVVGAADVTFGNTGGATRVARSASGAAEERRPLHVDDRTSARVALRVEPGAAATGVTKPVDMVATLGWRGGTAARAGRGKGGCGGNGMRSRLLRGSATVKQSDGRGQRRQRRGAGQGPRVGQEGES